MLSDKIELYGAPQMRGERVFVDEKSHRVMKMIEDLPTLGPVTASLRLDHAPARVYDAITGEHIPFSVAGDGRIELSVPSLHVHRAVVVATGA